MRKKNSVGFIAVTCFLAATTSALAQSPARLPGEDKGWVQWLIALGILVLISASAFLNPKRSHLT